MQTQPIKSSILSNKKKLIPIVLIALVGIILLIVGGTIGNEKSKSTSDLDIISVKDYVSEQEKKIALLCNKASGVSNATVIVTVDGGYEYMYAQNSSEKVSNGNYELDYKYVTIGSGSSQKLVLVSQNPPKINGIAIVCTGGDNPETQKKLISLISAAYNIRTNKIYIIGARN